MVSVELWFWQFWNLTEKSLVYGSGSHNWCLHTVFPTYAWHEMMKLCQLETWDMRISLTGPPVYLNVNISISSPCVHTFMYVFKVTCRPGLGCVTEQKGFWQQYFVALTNSSSTVMLKYLFHVPSLHYGNTSEGRTESHRWNTFKFTPFFSFSVH